MKNFVTLKRIYQHFMLGIANTIPMSGHGVRPFIIKWSGVNIVDPSNTFIGKGVIFDGVRPDLITIEPGVRLTTGASILTHFYNPMTGHYDKGSVTIKKDAFIGANAIITKPVTIGMCSVVGAGSVVTKDIPDFEIWAGNPAKFLKTLPH